MYTLNYCHLYILQHLFLHLKNIYNYIMHIAYSFTKTSEFKTVQLHQIQIQK